MTTTFVLIASGILIGAGIGVIWRDMQRNRRKAFVLQRDLSTGEYAGDAEVEITISHRQTAAPAAYAGLSSLGSGPAHQPLMRTPSTPLAQLQAAVASYDQGPEPWPAYGPEAGPEAGLEMRHQDAPAPTVEAHWAGLQTTIAAGIAQVNTVLAPARLRLGAPGEVAWSYKNNGYGAYRRLLLGEESLAWVRIELSSDGVLGVGIKAHKDEWAALNGTAGAPADGLTPAAVSDLLSACLKPAATHAAQLPRSGQVRATSQATGDGAWQDVEAIVSAALRATNGALAQTGARLLPLAPAAWDVDLRRHRMTLAVEVDAADVARMQIERLPHEMEVAVGVRDAQMIDLGRRRRIPIDGMTTHALAEIIASCAWPAIARFKEARGPA